MHSLVKERSQSSLRLPFVHYNIVWSLKESMLC